MDSSEQYKRRMADRFTDKYIDNQKAGGNFVCDNRKRYDAYEAEHANVFQKISMIIFFILVVYLFLCLPGKHGTQSTLEFNKYILFYSFVMIYFFVLLGYFVSDKYLFDFNEKEIIHKTRYFYHNESSIIKFNNINAIGVSVPFEIKHSKYETYTIYYYEVFFIFLNKNGLNYEIIEKGKLGKNNVDYAKLNEVNLRAKLFSERFNNIEYYEGEVGRQIGIEYNRIITRDESNFLIEWDPRISKLLVYFLGIIILTLGYVVYMDEINYALESIKGTTVNKTVNSTKNIGS